MKCSVIYLYKLLRTTITGGGGGLSVFYRIVDHIDGLLNNFSRAL